MQINGPRRRGKRYQEVVDEHIEELARANLGRATAHVKKKGRSFDLMLSCFEAGLGTGDKSDEALRELFRTAKLNVDDAFHWWELLHLFVAVHTNRPPGAHVWTDEFKEDLIRDCVQIGCKQTGRISIPKYCKILTTKPGDYEYRQTEENLYTQISRFGWIDEIKVAVRRARKKGGRSERPTEDTS
jgi:hypothetical protein